jgi:Undecaprenyl-phosphate glucose phosphotransferase
MGGTNAPDAFLARTPPRAPTRDFRMGGLMPVDPHSKDVRLVPAVAEAGWRGSGALGSAPHWTGRRAWTATDPLPPVLLIGAVLLADVILVAGVGLAVALLPDSGGRPAPALVALATLICMAVAGAMGAYGHAALFGSRRASARLVAGLATAIGALELAAHAFGSTDAVPVGPALLWFAAGSPLLLAGRATAALAFRAAAERTRQRAVLVGDGPQAARFVDAVKAQQDRSLRLLGLVDDGLVETADAERGHSGLPRIGSMQTLCSMIRRGEVDQVIFTLPWASEERLLRLQATLADYPVDLRLAPDLAAYHRGGAETGPEVGKLRLLRLADRPMRGLAGAAKTVEDYALALGALAVAAVPMALIALAVRLDSPGPVLFRQRRTGFNNKDFFVFKFRTMYHEHADYDVQRQADEGDPRVTRVGAILRRTSLDELPQIFNVLRGDMSFIGPRPHAPGTRAGGKLFEDVTDRYAARHRVKPGLTGLAQVRGYRGKTDTEEKLILRVESDLEYIENWSLWLDVVILVRTLLAVARMRNAH